MVWVNAIVQGILLGGLYALFACGLSLVFGVMRIVNLAHGDLAVVAAFLAFSLMRAAVHLAAAVIVVPAVRALGYGLHRALLHRSLAVGPLSTLLATFGLSVVIQNVLLQVYSADTQALDIGSLGSGSMRLSTPDLDFVPRAAHVRARVVVLVGAPGVPVANTDSAG